LALQKEGALETGWTNAIVRACVNTDARRHTTTLKLLGKALNREAVMAHCRGEGTDFYDGAGMSRWPVRDGICACRVAGARRSLFML
jgi:hypothetical protein